MPKDPKTEYRYIFGIVDAFSRKLWTTPLKTKESLPIVTYLKETFLNQYFLLWQADNGGEFTSHNMSEFLASVGGKEIHSAPKHPQTNGKIECIWSTLKIKLQSVSNKTK
jgi:transposase InsO family protein